jgi:hypothetical protein
MFDYVPPEPIMTEPVPIEYVMSSEELSEYQGNLDDMFSLDNIIDDVSDDGFYIDTSRIEFPREENDSIDDFVPGSELSRPYGKSGLGLMIINDNSLIFNDAFLPSTTTNGDDYGFTHGMALYYSQDLAGDLYLNMAFGSNLYTKLLSKETNEDGIKISNQLFVNENYVDVRIDNLQKPGDFHSILNFGYHNVQSENSDGLLNASFYQYMWHNLFADKGVISLPNNISGNYNESGFYLGFTHGISKNIFFTPNLAMTWNTEVGALLSTLINASNLNLSTEVALSYQTSPESLGIKLIAGADVIQYLEGTKETLEGRIVLGNDDFSIEAAASKDFGQGNPSVLYDDMNGDVFDWKHSLVLRVFF